GREVRRPRQGGRDGRGGRVGRPTGRADGRRRDGARRARLAGGGPGGNADRAPFTLGPHISPYRVVHTWHDRLVVNRWHKRSCCGEISLSSPLTPPLENECEPPAP